MDENQQNIQNDQTEKHPEPEVFTGSVEGQAQPNAGMGNWTGPQPEQRYGMVEPVKEKSGICTAALVLGIVSFFINPLYLVSITGLILGIVGINKKPVPVNRNLGGWGIGLSGASILIQLILDIIITICTAGMGFVSFFC